MILARNETARDYLGIHPNLDLALERINEEAIPEAERVSLEDMICTGAEVTGIYENGEPAGFLVTRDYRRICYLAFLAVRSDLRSRGLGGQAVRALIRLHPEQIGRAHV